eukprot:6492089-Amphidinium_carterae.3
MQMTYIVHLVTIKVKGAVNFLENAASCLRSARRGGFAGFGSRDSRRFAYKAVDMVKLLLLAQKTTSQKSLASVMEGAITAVFPALAEATWTLFHSNNTRIPSSSTLSRGGLFLDCALCFAERARERSELKVRYAMADSSPQHNVDWLFSSFDEVPVSAVRQCFHIVQRMALSQKPSEEDAKVLATCVRRHHSLPQALGSGATSLTNKVVALTFAWSLGRNKETLKEDLQSFLSSFISCCTDMGTEIGLAEYLASEPTALLPDWFKVEATNLDDMVEMASDDGLANPFDMDVCEDDVVVESGMLDDIVVESGFMLDDVVVESEMLDDLVVESGKLDDLDTDVCVAEDNIVLEAASESFYKEGLAFMRTHASARFMLSAFSVPGLLHICHNIQRELCEHMQHWQTFFSNLKQFSLLWSDGRRDRFIRFCVLPALGYVPQELNHFKLKTLYTARWNEVCGFCSELKFILPTIRLTWSAQNFLSGPQLQSGQQVGKEESEFDARQMTTILEDHFFESYLDMVLSVHKTVGKLSAWAEQCPCHSHSCGSRTRRCPLAGMMLPELVCGWMEATLAEVRNQLQEARVNMLVHNTPSEVFTDFNAVSAHLEALLQVKLDFTLRAPWCLAALATTRPDWHKIRGMVSACLQAYDAATDDERACHHPYTHLFMHRASLVRSELQLFLAGKDLCQLPRLEFHAACFRYVSVAERYVEATHSLVKRKVHPGSSGVLASLTRRVHQIEATLVVEPTFFEELVQYFIAATKVHQLPEVTLLVWLHNNKALGVAQHPLFADCSIRKMRHSRIVALLRTILYRTDQLSMYPDVGVVAKHHQKALQCQRRHADQLLRYGRAAERIVVCQETVTRRAMLDYVRQKSEESGGGILYSVQNVAAKDLGVLSLSGAMTVNEPERSEDFALDVDTAETQNDAVALETGCIKQGDFGFKVVKGNPASWHIVTTAASASRRLRQDDLVVAVFSVQRHEDKVYSFPSSSITEAVVVLRNLFFQLPFSRLESSLTRWQVVAVIPSAPPPPVVTFLGMIKALCCSLLWHVSQLGSEIN